LILPYLAIFLFMFFYGLIANSAPIPSLHTVVDRRTILKPGVH